MIVKYDGREYTFDPEEIELKQAMVIKGKTGYNLLQWQAALEQGDPDALRAMYWLMLTQSGEVADMDLVNFKIVRFAEALRQAQETEGESEPDPTTPEHPAS